MKRVLKWGAMSLAAVVLLVAAAFGVIYAMTQSDINEKVNFVPKAVAVPTEAEGIERGRHLVATRGCVDCHGKDYGGVVVAEDPLLGRLAGTNLTSGEGGIARTYTDADWVGAIRHGIGPGGRKLRFMPSHEYTQLDDTDLGQMIAYLKSLPPVDRTSPEFEAGPLMRVLAVTGELMLLPADHIDHEAERAAAPPVGPTAEYGKYMAMTCTGCHGEGFSGGKIPGTPPEWLPASNLTPDKETGLGDWTHEQFVVALREGERPDGTKLDERYMPIGVTKQFTDVEIAALWEYLRTVPSKPEGGR